VAQGTLYIVSTPIGNLEDITVRALRILREVDLIAAEDTRHVRKLLSAYDIHTPVTSYFEHNETRKSRQLLEKLADGTSIALVSDAGTPGISDPGYPIITAAIAQAVPIVPIPGPSALITALTVSGLPFDKFVFIGFLTNKRSGRIKQLRQIQAETKTVICYVSPHHLLNALDDVHDVLGNRQIAVARELTKAFEEVLRGPVAAVLEAFRQRPAVKGELTLIIAGAEPKEAAEIDDKAIRAALAKRIAEYGLSRRDAVNAVAAEWGLPKNRVYRQSLKLEESAVDDIRPS
jgi:16S rRNA (cytidine1402-2'-O)-methyltransferase